MQESIRLIARVNADGMIQYINQEYVSWLGYSAEELAGKSTIKLRAPNWQEAIQKAVVEQCQKNLPVNMPI